MDLTPTYTPPPQHTRKGRGVRPEVIPAGGLIDLANSKVEEKIKIPEGRAWQKKTKEMQVDGLAGTGSASVGKGGSNNSSGSLVGEGGGGGRRKGTVKKGGGGGGGGIGKEIGGRGKWGAGR